jgi:type II secretory pathway pseudopilin PulG
VLPREQRLGALEGILSLLVNGNDSRARPAKESTMTSKTQNAENRHLDDHELDLVCGGFTLIEMLVQINQISIIMGMQAPATTVNPNHRN